MSIKIYIDNQAAVYFPGQTIVGRVEVSAHQSISTRGVAIKFTGQGNTRWRTGSQKNRRTHIGSEEYYVGKVYLFGNGSDTVTLNPGHHVYPINFTLPQNIPSSYESVTGQVRHQCKAKINIPWGFDITDVIIISVNHIYDLNRDQICMNPVNRKEKKTFTFSSGSIYLSLMIDRTGFVPGEKLRVYVDVENDSDKVIEFVKMKLIQDITYKSNGGTTRSDTMTIAKMRVEGITGRGNHVIWSNTGLEIPAVPASYLTHCNIIDIRYMLKLQMSPSGWTSKMDMNQPITIGNVPLQRHFNLYQMITNRTAPGTPINQQLPQAPAEPRMNIQQPTAPPVPPHGAMQHPSAPPALPGAIPDNPPPYDPNWLADSGKGQPPVHPGIEEYPEMPPPSYGESKHSVPLEDGQHSDGAPMKSFIPSYVTFNPQASRPGTPN